MIKPTGDTEKQQSSLLFTLLNFKRKKTIVQVGLLSAITVAFPLRKSKSRIRHHHRRHSLKSKSLEASISNLVFQSPSTYIITSDLSFSRFPSPFRNQTPIKLHITFIWKRNKISTSHRLLQHKTQQNQNPIIKEPPSPTDKYLFLD